ncbi:hypothetical protein Vi05172_g11791 [Venturia inaequalis]|nr:hypothetical protein Vi05172_g11791 [Venturia inaequalis]
MLHNLVQIIRYRRQVRGKNFCRSLQSLRLSNPRSKPLKPNHPSHRANRVCPGKRIAIPTSVNPASKRIVITQQGLCLYRLQRLRHFPFYAIPRKTVYGKRPNKASAFTVSNVFLTSNSYLHNHAEERLSTVPNETSTFTVSNVFLTPNSYLHNHAEKGCLRPTKITRPSTATGSKTGHGTIAEATIALQQLQIAVDHENREIEHHVVSDTAPEERTEERKVHRKRIAYRRREDAK